MWNGKKISVILPAYNEEENIGTAIQEFLYTEIVDEVLVVDNNSTDRTAEIVKKSGAALVKEERQGYGFALRRGLQEATGDLVFTAEPDGTFCAGDVKKFLAYSDEFDVVLGTRTNKGCIWEGANMYLLLRLGNVFVAKLMEYLFDGPSLTDVGCTFKLIRREALDRIKNQFTVGRSHFSPEYMILCLKNKFRIVEIPVNYRGRIGTSKITGDIWRAFKLGWIMIGLIFSYRFDLIKPEE